MLNVIVLIGRLVRDPDLGYGSPPSGKAVCTFTLAVDRGFQGQQGKKEVDWVDCVVWEKQAEIVAQHLTKGRLVAVEGRLQVRAYEGKDGTKRKVAEVVAKQVRFLDKGKAADKGESDVGHESGLGDDDMPF